MVYERGPWTSGLDRPMVSKTVFVLRKPCSLPTISADSDLKFNKIEARIQPQYHVTQLVVTWYNTLLADWSMPYNCYNSRNRKYTLVVFSAEKC